MVKKVECFQGSHAEVPPNLPTKADTAPSCRKSEAGECAPRAALENAPSGRVFPFSGRFLDKNANFWRFLEIPPPPRIEPVTAPVLAGA